MTTIPPIFAIQSLKSNNMLPNADVAIPFLIAALGVGWVTMLLRRYGKVMHYVEIAMGIILIIVGVMLFLGTFEQLARFGVYFDFGL